MELQEGLAGAAQEPDNPEGIVIPDYIEPETAPPVAGDEMTKAAAADFVLTPAMKRSIAVIFAMQAM